MKTEYDKVLNRLRFGKTSVKLACKICMKDIAKRIFRDLDKLVKFSAWKYEYAQVKDKYLPDIVKKSNKNI